MLSDRACLLMEAYPELRSEIYAYETSFDDIHHYEIYPELDHCVEELDCSCRLDIDFEALDLPF